MPFIILIILFSFYNFSFASDFFKPLDYSPALFSYNDALDYHFKSANISNYDITTYSDYEKAYEKNNSLNLYLDFLKLDFSIGNDNYVAFMLIGTNNDSLFRPDGVGAGYITIWQQKADKFQLIASNEVYAIYGTSFFFDEEDNSIVIDSPMGQCETVFFTTKLNIINNKVYYKSIDTSFITAENILRTDNIYNSINHKPYLLNEKSGLTFHN